MIKAVSSDRPILRKKVLRLFLFVQVCIFAPMMIVSFFGCARTVETEVLHDTDTVIQHDTDTVRRDGPAWVRFINFLTKGGVIVLRTAGAGTALADATQIMRKEYTPIRSDSLLVIYTDFYIGSDFRTDSITIPADSLEPSSLTTIVLFQVEQDGGIVRIAPFFANDSLRLDPSPQGMAYIRFINGIADYPQPSPTVNLYMDNPDGAPLFLDNTGNSRPVSFLELRNYIPIAAGPHSFYVRKDGDPSVLYSSLQKLFRAGVYYTARLNGSKTSGNDSFTIDEE